MPLFPPSHPRASDAIEYIGDNDPNIHDVAPEGDVAVEACAQAEVETIPQADGEAQAQAETPEEESPVQEGSSTDYSEFERIQEYEYRRTVYKDHDTHDIPLPSEPEVFWYSEAPEGEAEAEAEAEGEGEGEGEGDVSAAVAEGGTDMGEWCDRLTAEAEAN
ncbi:hypothetical protein KIPB_014537, partial [Kipferlia bialata]|eukprot:g14537.t1